MKKMMAIIGIAAITSTGFAGVLNKKSCPDQGDVQRLLLEAAALDNLQTVINLRNCPGADINSSWHSSKGSGTAISLAVSNKANRVTEYLLKDSTVEINKGEVIFTDDGYEILPTLEKALNHLGWGLSDSDLEKVVLAFNKRADFDPNLHSLTSYGNGAAPLLLALELKAVKTFKALLQNSKTNINVRRINGNLQGFGVIATASYLEKSCQIIESVLNKNEIDLNKTSETELKGMRDSDMLRANVRSPLENPDRDCQLKLLKRIFLDSRFNVNQQSATEGWTDLMSLSAEGDDELLMVMLSRADININLCSKNGKSALDVAVEYNKTNTIKILKSYGAKSCLD